MKGKTAINSSGSVITGTYSLPSVNVTAGNMLSGTSAINSSGSVVYGTMVNRGSITASLSAGGSKSYSAGYYSGGTVTGSDSLQFAWAFLYNVNRNWYQLGLNSNYGSASGATWTCHKTGTYRIVAICNDSIGNGAVGIKKNGSWLVHGNFVNKTQDLSLSYGNTIQIIGGNMYGDTYSPCVGVVVIWHI